MKAVVIDAIRELYVGELLIGSEWEFELTGYTPEESPIKLTGISNPLHLMPEGWYMRDGTLIVGGLEVELYRAVAKFTLEQFTEDEE